MRDILFRGKRIDNGEWVEGGISVEDDTIYIMHKTRYYPDTRDSYTLDYYEENPHYAYSKVAVIPETVGQFTGMFDKNGKKIFEGDVVLDYYGRTAHVKFFDGRYLPFNRYPEYKCLSASECIVIGNIWDNPELVEGP